MADPINLGALKLQILSSWQMLRDESNPSRFWPAMCISASLSSQQAERSLVEAHLRPILGASVETAVIRLDRVVPAFANFGLHVSEVRLRSDSGCLGILMDAGFAVVHLTISMKEDAIPSDMFFAPECNYDLAEVLSPEYLYSNDHRLTQAAFAAIGFGGDCSSWSAAELRLGFEYAYRHLHRRLFDNVPVAEET